MHDREKRGTPSSGMDGDGVRIVENAGRGRRRAAVYKLLALILVGCSAGYLLTIDKGPPDAEPPGSQGQETRGRVSDGNTVATAQSPPFESAPVSRRELTARPPAPGRDPNDLASYSVPGQPAPSVEEVIDRLHEAGIHSGIGAFQPPGTSPPLIGLAVPEDYVLPEGYVRHFQATDDGQRIEPILMFSPDFEFFDAAGNPIRIPQNRVVPPDMAPPGLAIRRIEIPPALEPRSPAL